MPVRTVKIHRIDLVNHTKPLEVREDGETLIFEYDNKELFTMKQVDLRTLANKVPAPTSGWGGYDR